MTVPDVFAALLSGWPEPGTEEQVFPLLTTDSDGCPHVTLLSRSELAVGTVEGTRLVLATVAGTTTTANVHRDRCAMLVAVEGTTAHYARLELRHHVTDERMTGFAFAVTHHRTDSLGIPLAPMAFTPTEELAKLERWDTSRRLLDALTRGDLPTA